MNKKVDIFIFSASFKKEQSGQDFFLENFYLNLSKEGYNINLVLPKVKKRVTFKKEVKIFYLDTGFKIKDYSDIQISSDSLCNFYTDFNNKILNFINNKCDKTSIIILNGYELCLYLEKVKKICRNVIVILHYMAHEIFFSRAYSDETRKKYLSMSYKEKIINYILNLLGKEKALKFLKLTISHRKLLFLMKKPNFYFTCMANLLSKDTKIIIPDNKIKKEIEFFGKKENLIVLKWPYNPSSKKTSHNLSRKYKIYTFLGRIADQKGLEYLLEALKLLEKEGYYDIKVNLCGEPTAKEFDYYLKLKESSMKLNHIKVNFLGVVKGQKKVKVIVNSDFTILPSIYEPFGYAVLESIDYGKIPIISNAYGPLNMIDKKYAFIADFSVPNKRVNNLYMAIKKSYFSKRIIPQKIKNKILARHSKKIDISSLLKQQS